MTRGNDAKNALIAHARMGSETLQFPIKFLLVG